jgi:Putative Actinobacterial Holin-X, holin superfamily III
MQPTQYKIVAMPTDKQAFFEETQELIEDYISNRVQLLKLQVAEKSSRVVTMLFAGLVMGLLAFFILLFTSIMAAYYFSGIMHSQFYGFGTVALIYTVLLLLAIYLRKAWLDKFIFAKVVKILFESNTDNNEAV